MPATRKDALELILTTYPDEWPVPGKSQRDWLLKLTPDGWGWRRAGSDYVLRCKTGPTPDITETDWLRGHIREYRRTAPQPPTSWDGKEPLRAGHTVDRGVVMCSLGQDVCIADEGFLRIFNVASIEPVRDKYRQLADRVLCHYASRPHEHPENPAEFNLDLFADCLRELEANGEVKIP